MFGYNNIVRCRYAFVRFNMGAVGPKTSFPARVEKVQVQADETTKTQPPSPTTSYHITNHQTQTAPSSIHQDTMTKMTTMTTTASKVLDVQQLDDYLISHLLLGTGTTTATTTTTGSGTSSSNRSSSSSSSSNNNRPLSYILQCALELTQNIYDMIKIAENNNNDDNNNDDDHNYDGISNNSNHNSSSNMEMKKTKKKMNMILNSVIWMVMKTTKQVIESATIQDLIVKFWTLVITQGRTPAVQALHLDVTEAGSSTGTSSLLSGNDQQRLHHEYHHHQQQLQQNINRRKRRQQRRIFVYAALETVVPFWYEYYIKQKALRWLATPPSPTPTPSSISSGGDEVQRQLEHQRRQQRLVEVRLKREERRRLFVRKLLQTVDTIIPLVRLGLLMNVWWRRRASSTTTNRASSLPFTTNLAMALSGLQYHEEENGNFFGGGGGDGGSDGTSSSSSSLSLVPFFVLYAHRRWIHTEAVRLWSAMGQPFVRTCTNTTRQIRTVLNSIIDNHRHRRRQQQRHQRRLLQQQQQQQDFGSGTKSSSVTIAKAAPSSSSSSYAKPCPFCQRDHQQIVVPYKMEPCGHVACYVCLWNFVKSHCHRNNISISSQSPPCCPICDEDFVHCSQAV